MLKLDLTHATSPFLLAVSGGRDSMALLHLCHIQHLEFKVAHLDHALRQDSRLDAEFVRRICAELELPFFSERIEVAAIAQKKGWSLEEAARKVRYEFLHRTAKTQGCKSILTAHTLEDNAETVLLQLLRGTGKATGIPAKNGRVVRPLLTVSKQKLEQHLRQTGLTWREDGSNLDLRFTRNWLRLEVMPRLLERFPNAVQALANYADIAQAEEVLLEELSELSEWADLRLQTRAIQRRHIRKMFVQSGLQANFWHIERLRQALGFKHVARVSLPEDHIGFVQNGKIYIYPPDKNVGGKVERTPGSPLQVAQNAFPEAILRTRAKGDTISLTGGTKKLSEVLIDRKIPREERNHIAVLAVGSRVVFADTEPPLLDASLPQYKDIELEAMREALSEPASAAARGEVPVGAVVLHHQQIIAKASNRATALLDMTQHAELEALRLAAAELGSPYLTDCTLVVTLEPCLMCLGAALEARVGRIVFAARNPKNGALGGVLDATRAAWNHHFSVRAGVLERQASALLSEFFANKRTG